jgi:hypothetical protein
MEPGGQAVKLVIVVDVEGVDPGLVDPWNAAEALLVDATMIWAAFVWTQGGTSARYRFLRAEWADNARRGDVDELLEDEEEG